MRVLPRHLCSSQCPSSTPTQTFTAAWGVCVRRAVQDYVLNKQLYRGKASTLYHATCRQSGQAVVLKSYSKRRLSNLNWYQVDRELRLHSALGHENIIALYAAFEDADHVFLVQEYAAGMPPEGQALLVCTPPFARHCTAAALGATDVCFPPGGDLYEDLKRAGGQYKERHVARDILPPFLAALQYLHARNIIHRQASWGAALLPSCQSTETAAQVI
jgi:aurora kinase